MLLSKPALSERCTDSSDESHCGWLPLRDRTSLLKWCWAIALFRVRLPRFVEEPASLAFPPSPQCFNASVARIETFVMDQTATPRKVRGCTSHLVMKSGCLEVVNNANVEICVIVNILPRHGPSAWDRPPCRPIKPNEPGRLVGLHRHLKPEGAFWAHRSPCPCTLT